MLSPIWISRWCCLIYEYQDDAVSDMYDIKIMQEKMMLTSPTTAQSVVSSMLGLPGGSSQVALHFAWVEATSDSDRSYILIISESHILVVSELIWPSRLQILTLSLVFSGSGSCVPHLKVVDWMASGCKWIGIGTGSQILFVLLQTPAQCSPTITHFNWLCFAGMEKQENPKFGFKSGAHKQCHHKKVFTCYHFALTDSISIF